MGWELPWYPSPTAAMWTLAFDSALPQCIRRDGRAGLRHTSSNGPRDEAMGTANHWSYLDMTALGTLRRRGGLARGFTNKTPTLPSGWKLARQYDAEESPEPKWVRCPTLESPPSESATRGERSARAKEGATGRLRAARPFNRRGARVPRIGNHPTGTDTRSR